MSTVKPAAPAAITASCSFERSSDNAGHPMNVGERVAMICTGDFGAAPASSLQVVPEKPEAAYQLRVLKVNDSSSQQVKLVVTSYNTGNYQNVVYRLSDGKVTFVTSPLNFTVESVIDPAKPPTKPYPSLGPYHLPYPLWFWLMWAALGLVVVGTIGFVVARQRRRARLLAELDRYATMLLPFAQFSKDARQLARKLDTPASNPVEAFRKIEEDFRLYLIRELRVPALQVSNRELLREIKRSHRAIYENNLAELRRFLFELEKGKRDADKIKIKDCEELLFLSQRLADHIQAAKRNKRSSQAQKEGPTP